MKKFKIFAICCGMLAAGVLSTSKSYADDPNGIKLGACVGNTTHVCKTTPDGTEYYGYWVEGTFEF